MDNKYREVLIGLPTDYTEFGGRIDRYRFIDVTCSDCTGCKWFDFIQDSTEWGVCTNQDSNRAGLLTHTNQAGFKCFSAKDIK